MFAGLLDFARKDVDIPASAPKNLLLGLHANFISNFERKKESYEYVMAEPLRMSGIYWCASAMDVMGKLDSMNGEEIVSYVLEMQQPNGGFAPALGHDAHLLHTLCAIQLLYIFGALERLSEEKEEEIVEYVRRRQNHDGSFSGDESNEVDTRFSLCGLATLYLLNRMEAVDLDSATRFILSCYNSDGGFGTRPTSESHSGQVYCCVGALALMGRIDCIDRDRTAEWLAFRQCNSSGGLNGRPEKLPDVCYSWWVLASLAILHRLDWVNEDKLKAFILASQDDETGGLADRPGDYPDPFHTHFGVASLSLLGDSQLKPVDAVLCMTKSCLGSLSRA